jgi:hypothetical protein
MRADLSRFSFSRHGLSLFHLRGVLSRPWTYSHPRTEVFSPHFPALKLELPSYMELIVVTGYKGKSSAQPYDALQV